MGATPSTSNKVKSRGQQQRANRDIYNYNDYKFHYSQQQAIPARGVRAIKIYNFDDQKQGFNEPPMTQPPMARQYINSAWPFRELPRRAIGSGAAMPRFYIAQGVPRRTEPKDRSFQMVARDKVMYPKQVPQGFPTSKFTQRPLLRAETSKPSQGVVFNPNDFGPYKNHYAQYGNEASNSMSTSTRAQPLVYSVDNVSVKDDKLLNSQRSSLNWEAGSFRTSPYQYGNATKYVAGALNKRDRMTPEESSRSTGDLQKPDSLEDKRKLALKNLLIRPIVIMRGKAWDESDWKDFNTPRNFHASCADFLKIIALTKDQKMAMEIKDFLKSDLLTPRYTEKNQPPEQGKKLNHFHVFWNIMHQLPFSVKMWDPKTKEKLMLFYKVWVASTIQCRDCKGHYQRWIKEQPPLVSDRTSLSQWLFTLHNDVNQRTSKPQFQWDKYNQRWGPNDLQVPDERVGGIWSMSTPSKSISRFHGTLQTSSSRTWTNSSSGEVDEDSSSFKMYQPKEQNRSILYPKMRLPRRCLSTRQLYLRRNNVTQRNGPILPRNRVAVNARGISY